MEMLKANFQKEYKPSSHVTDDESMVLFKGRLAMKQYMPLKPKIEQGYKVWSIADSETGYLCKFDLYQGRTECQPTDVGLVFSRHALLTCSLKGQKDKGLHKPVAQRPPLHSVGAVMPFWILP
ncbi:hypothetical protein MTO96_017929 [Rhipicephalus appendiculatus]